MEPTMSTATRSNSSDLHPAYSRNVPSQKAIQFKANLFEQLSIVFGTFGFMVAGFGLVLFVDTFMMDMGFGSPILNIEFGWIPPYILVLAVLIIASWQFDRRYKKQKDLIDFYYETIVEGTIVEIEDCNINDYTIGVSMMAEGKNRAGEYLHDYIPIDVDKWRAGHYVVGQPYKFDSNTVG
jgi:hypothetical protein